MAFSTFVEVLDPGLRRAAAQPVRFHEDHLARRGGPHRDRLVTGRPWEQAPCARIIGSFTTPRTTRAGSVAPSCSEDNPPPQARRERSASEMSRSPNPSTCAGICSRLYPIAGTCLVRGTRSRGVANDPKVLGEEPRWRNRNPRVRRKSKGPARAGERRVAPDDLVSPDLRRPASRSAIPARRRPDRPRSEALPGTRRAGSTVIATSRRGRHRWQANR
jgi:hypothetical protein